MDVKGLISVKTFSAEPSIINRNGKTCCSINAWKIRVRYLNTLHANIRLGRKILSSSNNSYLRGKKFYNIGRGARKLKGDNLKVVWA